MLLDSFFVLPLEGSLLHEEGQTAVAAPMDNEMVEVGDGTSRLTDRGFHTGGLFPLDKSVTARLEKTGLPHRHELVVGLTIVNDLFLKRHLERLVTWEERDQRGLRSEGSRVNPESHVLSAMNEQRFVLGIETLVTFVIESIEVGGLDAPHEGSVGRQSVVVILDLVEPSAITRGGVFHPDPRGSPLGDFESGEGEQLVATDVVVRDVLLKRYDRHIPEKAFDRLAELLGLLQSGRAGDQKDIVFGVGTQLLKKKR